MTEIDAAPPYSPHAAAPDAVEAAIDAAEAQVKRLERAILHAASEDAARDAREELTLAELRLQDLLDLRPGCGSCEGWPRGK